MLSASARASIFICIRPSGCPTAAPPPRLSTTQLTHIIETYLSAHPPVIRLVLRRSLGSYAPVAYDDLARAGLLRIVAGKQGQAPGPRYDLTAKGHEVFDEFVQGKPAKQGVMVIDIPVGEFRYVRGSVVLVSSEFGRSTATFKYYFSGSTNADLLLRSGPAMDWVIAGYSMPYVNFDQIGRVAEQAVPLQICHGKWTVQKVPTYLCSHP